MAPIPPSAEHHQSNLNGARFVCALQLFWGCKSSEDPAIIGALLAAGADAAVNVQARDVDVTTNATMTRTPLHAVVGNGMLSMMKKLHVVTALLATGKCDLALEDKVGGRTMAELWVAKKDDLISTAEDFAAGSSGYSESRAAKEVRVVRMLEVSPHSKRSAALNSWAVEVSFGYV